VRRKGAAGEGGRGAAWGGGRGRRVGRGGGQGAAVEECGVRVRRTGGGVAYI
jgi:hypothetical protein